MQPEFSLPLQIFIRCPLYPRHGTGRWARPTPTESALEPADEVLGIGGRRWNRFTGCEVWLRHEHEKDYLCEPGFQAEERP